MALYVLYVFAGLSLLTGGLMWLGNRESSPLDLEALAWAQSGLNIAGFGVLVLVLAIATQAIVEAIESLPRRLE